MMCRKCEQGKHDKCCGCDACDCPTCYPPAPARVGSTWRTALAKVRKSSRRS